MADSIIQDIVDPLILQPASLDLATLKKRAGDDLVSSTGSTSSRFHLLSRILNETFQKLVIFLLQGEKFGTRLGRDTDLI